MGLCPHLSSETHTRLCSPKSIFKDNKSKKRALSPPQFWNTQETVTLTYFKDNMSENAALSPPQFWNTHETVTLTYLKDNMSENKVLSPP